MNKFLVFSFLFSLIGSQSLFADQCKYGPEETAKLYKQYTGSELEGDVSEAIEKLEYLSIGMKGFSEKDFDFLCPFKNVSSLDIYNDKQPEEKQLDGSRLSELVKWMPKLTYIDFDYNRIDPKNLLELNALKELKFIKLLGNDLGLKDFKLLAKFKVAAIVLGDNQWESAKTEDLIFLLENSSSQKLDFGGVMGADYSQAPNLQEAFSKAKFSKTLKSLSIAGGFTGKAMLNLLSPEHSLTEIACSKKVLEPEVLAGDFPVNTNMEQLSCSMPTEIQLKLMSQMPKVDSIFISYPTEEKALAFEAYSDFLIQLGSNNNWRKIIEWEHLKKFLEMTKSHRIHFLGFISISHDEKDYSLSDFEEELLELCPQDRCYVGNYDKEEIREYFERLRKNKKSHE